MNWNQILEDAILGRVIIALIDEDFRLVTSDHNGGELFIYAVPNGGELPDGGFSYWVKLVRGNGPDMISDYTANLEAALKSAIDFAVQFQA